MATSSHPLLAFYRGQAATESGYRIEDIWNWDYGRLEAIHDYIQWLFPLKEPSRFNPDAPVLDDDVIQAFQADPELQARLSRSLETMLDFYGLKFERDEIVEAEHFSERARLWITPYNHNFLRLTRILTSLSLLGRRSQAEALLTRLSEIYKSHAEPIGAHTIQFWRAAI